MPKKAARSNSNVFSMFEKKQIDEFKEAFGLLDKNSDGKIDERELKGAFDELGRRVKDEEIKSMLGEVDGPMNFNSFLAMFGEKLNGTDEEQMVFEAFKLLDDKGQGQITKAALKEMLTANGRPADRLSEAEFDEAMQGAPVNKSGLVDYEQFVKLIKNGKQDDE